MKRQHLHRLWIETRRILLLVLGSMITALGFSLFQVPYNIAAGGISGIGIIVNHFTGVSVSLFYLVANIPLLLLGFFYLGRWRFLITTVIAVFLFSLGTEYFPRVLPQYMSEYPITDNVLLAAIYAGLIGGIGGGLIYAAGATMGGTGIVGRIIQIKTGIPLSQIYLFVDGTIIVTAGIVFGWNIALYAMLTLLLNGLATDYVLEGPSRARTAFIITNRPSEMIEALATQLGRGTSHWEIRGGYTGEPRTMVLCTIYRPQVNDLKRIVGEVDPSAFVAIGMTQQALGEGFTDLRRVARSA
jgi:uncharacterized membrane-anchored protein YitT (DUF2179 family)